MAKLGGQKMPSRGPDKRGEHQVKGGPANGKGGAKVKTGGKGKARESMKNGNC